MITPAPRPSSADDLPQRVESALLATGQIAGKNLRIEVHDGTVVLKGSVRSYYHKQLAQETLRAVHGVDRIANEIEVVAHRSTRKKPH